MTIGIDTSCYTTSIAAVQDGEIILDKRILLTVKQGDKGLRQSDAIFQHNANITKLMSEADIDYSKVTAVCVSDKPRSVEGSYMPVFTAGICYATILSRTLGVPLHYCSHQQGHILAGLHSACIPHMATAELLVWHISGGTTELLHYNNGTAEIIGGTLDISAGQLIDRAGVAMGLPFPAGKSLDQMCGELTHQFPLSMKGSYFNLSGIQNKAEQLMQSDPTAVAAAIFDTIARCLHKATVAAQLNIPVLIVGGVASNRYIRSYLTQHLQGVHFASPELSTDNAVGVALHI